MDVGLLIAGLICVAMGFGHQTIGVVWVLPHVTEEDLPGTPFGSSGMSVAMIRVSWYIVTIFVMAVGSVLLGLAWDASVDTKTLILRVLAVMWFAATAMAMWVARDSLRHPRRFLRLPVPVLWVIVGVLCWMAST